MKTIEQAYSDYKAMIKSFAAKYSKRYHLEFEELEAEGNLTFCSAYQKFNPSRGNFSTYLYTCLNNCMKNYCAAAARIRAYEECCGDQIDQYSYFPTEENFNRLDSNQQSVLEVALDLAPEKKANKKHITNELRNRGWSRRQVIETFHSLKQTVEAAI